MKHCWHWHSGWQRDTVVTSTSATSGLSSSNSNQPSWYFTWHTSSSSSQLSWLWWWQYHCHHHYDESISRDSESVSRPHYQVLSMSNADGKLTYLKTVHRRHWQFIRQTNMKHQSLWVKQTGRQLSQTLAVDSHSSVCSRHSMKHNNYNKSKK